MGKKLSLGRSWKELHGIAGNYLTGYYECTLLLVMVIAVQMFYPKSSGNYYLIETVTMVLMIFTGFYTIIDFIMILVKIDLHERK